MSSIVILLVLLAVGFAVVRSVARSAGNGSSTEPETTGLFVYIAMYVALLTFAIGLSGVIGGIIDRPAAGRAITAGELSSTVIGLPVFIALARTTLRRLRSNDAERGGTGWSLYINIALLTTLAVTLIAGYWLMFQVVDGERVGIELGLVIVWAPLWFLHWRVWNEVGDTRRPELYWFLAATVGIAMLTSAAVWIIAMAVERIVDELGSGSAAIRDTNDLEGTVILLLLGAVTWWWHWLRTGRLVEESSPSRVAYLLIVGVFGGLAMMYVGAVGSLVHVLIWLFGDPDSNSARRFFEDVFALGPSALVGAAVWWYHRAELGPRRDADRTEIDRLYSYLVAGVAALVTTGALITLGVVVLTLLTPATAVSSDASSSNIVLSAIALALFGAPTWYVSWRDAQAQVAEYEAEASSRTRRLYLLAMLAIAGSVAFAAGIATLSAVLGAVTGERSGSLVGNLRIPLASLVGAGALGWYHLRLYLAERSRFERTQIREVTLVVPSGVDIGPVEELVGVAVSRIDMAPDGLDDVDIAAVVAAVESSDARKLMAIVREGDVELIPLA